MKIWMEGYAATGESGTAIMIKEYPDKTFEEAIQLLTKERENDSNPVRERNGVYSIWGCRLFDNESEARKSFG